MKHHARSLIERIRKSERKEKIQTICLTHLKLWANISATLSFTIGVIWFLVGLMVLGGFLILPYWTTYHLSQNIWAIELLATPTIVILGLAIVRTGGVWILEEQESTTEGIFLIAIGIGILLLKAFAKTYGG